MARGLRKLRTERGRAAERKQFGPRMRSRCGRYAVRMLIGSDEDAERKRCGLGAGEEGCGFNAGEKTIDFYLLADAEQKV